MAATTERKKHVAIRKKKADFQHRTAKKSVVLQGTFKSKDVSGVSELRKKLNLTQPEFAGLLPVSVRTLATLEKGTMPTGSVSRRLTELERLTKALGEVVRENAIGVWLNTPNPAFGGLKPVEVIDRGESDRIWEMIYFLRSGVAS
jgi:DNA-binding transcriptional regulator YiaG